MSRDQISSVRGRSLWDSRGRPTVEVEIVLNDGATGRSIAPAGASTGAGEARELRDGGDAFSGYGVSKAVDAVNGEIAKALVGESIENQARLDRLLIDLDGTRDKSRLGANSLIATSMAIAHAGAALQRVPLWKSLAGDRPVRLPLPEIQIFGGGAHAARRIDIQDFMVIPVGARDYVQALEMTSDVYRAAGRILANKGLRAGVADEGGWWPSFDGNVQALELLVRAIEGAGYIPGRDVAISLDVAASEFHEDARYRLAADDVVLDSDGLAELLLGWVDRFPIVSIEDPFDEHDEEGLVRFTRAVGDKVQIVGDDYFVTDTARIERGIKTKACNAVLIKPNQIGTLTETLAAVDTAHSGGLGTIVSARSGETEDTTIVHLAVGWGVKQLKVGSFSRSERMAKWNEGLRIADRIGAVLPDTPVPAWRAKGR